MDIGTLLMKQNKKTIIGIMMNSLDLMQQYNGRTKTECIMEAIGAKGTENENGNMSWKVPSKKKIKDNSGWM